MNLQKIVNDFTFARDIDKKNRLQELEAHNFYSTFNKSAPFFSEDTQKFPEGTSSFRPSNQPNAYQALNQNVGNNQSLKPQNAQPYQPSQVIQIPKQPQPTVIIMNNGKNTSIQQIPYNQSNMFAQSQAKPGNNAFNASSQYGYLPFNNPSGSNFPTGFNDTTSSFVPNPFAKK